MPFLSFRGPVASKACEPPFRAITSAITDDYRRSLVTGVKSASMSRLSLLAGITLTLVSLVLLIKAGFDKLETRMARRSARRTGQTR